MTSFVIHDQNGAITRTGFCADGDVALQSIPDGHSIIKMNCHGVGFYVDLTNPDQPVLAQYGTPPSKYHAWDWPSKSFVLPSTALASAQADQSTLISNACAAACVAGTASSALGSPYTYPTKPQDQANIAADMLTSLAPGLSSTWTTQAWCMDANGVWAFMPHTAAQIQQVCNDINAFIGATRARNASLQAQIAAAKTIPVVQAITW